VSHEVIQHGGFRKKHVRGRKHLSIKVNELLIIIPKIVKTKSVVLQTGYFTLAVLVQINPLSQHLCRLNTIHTTIADFSTNQSTVTTILPILVQISPLSQQQQCRSSHNSVRIFFLYKTSPVGKHLSDMFPIKNGLKQGDALSLLFFNFALEYSFRGGSGKPGWLEIEWYTSAPGLC
jgi:hypothetical protein